MAVPFQVTFVAVDGVIVPDGGFAAKLNMAMPAPTAQKIKANRTRTLENADSEVIFFFIVDGYGWRLEPVAGWANSKIGG